jgi:hypothetical protein
MSGSIDQSKMYQQAEWIHDWDYKRILPEYPKQRSFVTEDVDMDMDGEPTHPSPVQSGTTSAHDQEMAIFWARIPKYLRCDESDISDDEEFRTLDSHGLHDDQAAFAPSFEQRRNSTNDLSAFNKPPPLSWDQQQNLDDTMKGDVDSVMSPLQDNEGLLTPMVSPKASPRRASNARFFPMCVSNGIAPMEEERMNVDGCARGAPKSGYPQQLLKEVVTHARHHLPAQQKPAPPQGQYRQLFQEMRHSYQERSPRQKLPTPPQEQQQLLQEMRHSYNERQQVGGLNKKDPRADVFSQQQQIVQELRQKTSPPLPLSAHGLPQAPPTPPRKDPYYCSSQTSSPISVSQIISGDLSREDYHAKVRQLTEKNLFERQQNLLQESMKRTLESRKALRAETNWPEEYERGDKLMKVLQQVDSTSLKISLTLPTGFGAA